MSSEPTSTQDETNHAVEDKEEKVEQEAKEEPKEETKEEAKAAENKEEAKEEEKKDEDTKEEKVEETKEEKEEEKMETEEVAGSSGDAPDPAKEEEENDNEDNEEDDDSDSDESLPPGLLERPVEIYDSKRERKKCVPFSFKDSSPGGNKKKVVITEGKGTQLGEIAQVEKQIGSNTVTDLKIIHRLFYGCLPELPNHCKKNLRMFSGFSFEKDSKEYQRKEEYLARFTTANLKWTATVLNVNLKLKNSKDLIIEAILDWCLEPQTTDRKVVEKRGRKSTTKKTPTKRSISKSKASGETPKKKARKSEAGTSKQKTPAKDKKKTPSKRSASASKSEGSAKKKSDGSAKKKKKSPTKVKITTPAASKTKKTAGRPKKPKAPTDDAIRDAVKKILEGADLEATTMKNVCCKVYEMFPDHNITEKKAYIKSCVKELISTT